MLEYSYLDEVDLLRREPTSERWGMHLRRLASGELDGYVRDRGSFEDYVATILADSKDPCVAETVFNKSLREVVQSWTPTVLDRPAKIIFFVDLIAAYTPSNGFVKLFSVLENEEQVKHLANVSDPLDLAHGRDLCRKILNTLDAYFPTAEPGKDQAYKDYIKILHAHLLIPGYVGHSARLLFRRNRLSLTGKKPLEILRRDLTAIRSILREIVKTPHRTVMEKNVRALYKHVLQVGCEALTTFDQELQRLGGYYQPTRDRAILILPEIGEIRLDLPENVVSDATFIKMRWAKAQQGWRVKESEIRSGLATGSV